MRLLIVDDENVIAQGLKYIVERMDTPFTDVDVALSAREAMACLEGARYDFLLTDIRMPDEDGLSLARRAVEAGLVKRYAIVTGYSDVDFVLTALRGSAADYLIKPVDKEQLKKLLFAQAAQIRTEQSDEIWRDERRLGDIINGVSFEEHLPDGCPRDALAAVVIANNLKDRRRLAEKFVLRLYAEGIAEYMAPLNGTNAMAIVARREKADALRALCKTQSEVWVGCATGTLKAASDLWALCRRAALAAIAAAALVLPVFREADEMGPMDVSAPDAFARDARLKYGACSDLGAYMAYAQFLERLNTGGANVANDENPYVAHIKRIVREEYAQNLSVKAVACRIGLNPDYTGRLFKLETGMNFQSYVNQYRVMRIVELIQANPNLSFEKIAPEMGFPEIRSFYRCFKKTMHMTPGEYRERRSNADSC